jgi:hypoxanthine phosphoribosyltransferase
VLIVDDIADSGETLLPYKIYQTAVLHYKMQSEHIPTYYVEEVDDNVWLSYPWEKDNAETIQDYLKNN